MRNQLIALASLSFRKNMVRTWGRTFLGLLLLGSAFTLHAQNKDVVVGSPYGKVGYFPVWQGSQRLKPTSQVFQTTNANGFVVVGIGTTAPQATLDVNGQINAATSYSLGGTAFAFGSYKNGNAFLGFAGNTSMTGTGNVASGWSAFQSNTSGSGNTAIGGQALESNTTGTLNSAVGQSALRFNTTGSNNTAVGILALQNNGAGTYNTALGYEAGPSAGNLTNTPAIGAYAAVAQSNALVLGGELGGGYAVNVGIDTPTPSNVFTIAQGAGAAIADGWDTYSSRRFKTNIHPLLGALDKVEHLQGVSYNRKSDGKSEIGVIAEDVDQVVPEIVSRNPKTNEVQGVDYSRLAALLIEAVKSQQAKIDSQQSEIDQLKEQVDRLTTKK